MVSHVNFNDLQEVLDRAGDQWGISLSNAEQFRRLDELSDTFDEADGSKVVLRNILDASEVGSHVQQSIEAVVNPSAE